MPPLAAISPPPFFPPTHTIPQCIWLEEQPVWTRGDVRPNLFATSHTQTLRVCVRSLTEAPVSQDLSDWFLKMKFICTAEPQGASAGCVWITRTWLVSFVTGDSKRLHLVVVIGILSSLQLSWSHLLFLLSQTTALLFCFRTLLFTSVLLPASSSDMRSPVQAPPSFSPLLHIFPNLFSLHPSLHLDPVWLGRTTSGSPHSLLLVRDLFAPETETETTHSLCCGFGKKIFVKFLPVLAPCAVPSDWSANSPFCWQVTGFLFSPVQFLQWINY